MNKKLRFKHPFKPILILFVLTGIAFSVHAQSAYEVIKKSEEQLRGVQSSQAEMTMTIVRPDWSRQMSLKSWSKGNDYAMILVTAPAKDKGTSNLKIKKEVWSWVPRIERSIKLPPSMMSQSWMGSDFTNDDLVRENTLSEDYTHKMLQDSVVEGRSCYKIELTPKEDAAVVWGKINMWIDKAEYLQMRAEFFDEDEYLVNIMQASNIKTMGGREFASKLEIIPVEEEGHKTVMEYKSIVFDKEMPARFFTVPNMKRVR